MKRLPILLLLIASITACSSRPYGNRGTLPVAPALTVERFLQAANTRDLATMSRLFGTDDGPIGDGGRRTEVELRMDLLAEILQHDNYEIVSERVVPGTEAPSNRVGVDLLLPGGNTVRDVGFTVVASDDRWLIIVIELVKITSAE